MNCFVTDPSILAILTDPPEPYEWLWFLGYALLFSVPWYLPLMACTVWWAIQRRRSPTVGQRNALTYGFAWALTWLLLLPVLVALITENRR